MVASLQISCRQVSEYFLRSEADKGDRLAMKLASGIFPDDPDFFREFRVYADECKIAKRVSPVLVWTVGIPGDIRFQDVKEWRLEKISLDELYSIAMGKNMKGELDAVKGNLKAFTMLVKNNPCRYPEFNLSCFPENEDKQTVIGVVHYTSGRQGSIELIDAAHRTVSMIANGMNYVPAYIAILK